jgi:hypothetical protein
MCAADQNNEAEHLDVVHSVLQLVLLRGGWGRGGGGGEGGGGYAALAAKARTVTNACMRARVCNE